MKLLVVDYSHSEDYHRCVDVDTGESYKVDLFVSGDMDWDIGNKGMVNKTINVNNMTPYIYVAQDVEIIEEGT